MNSFSAVRHTVHKDRRINSNWLRNKGNVCVWYSLGMNTKSKAYYRPVRKGKPWPFLSDDELFIWCAHYISLWALTLDKLQFAHQKNRKRKSVVFPVFIKPRKTSHMQLDIREITQLSGDVWPTFTELIVPISSQWTIPSRNNETFNKLLPKIYTR